MGAMEPGEGVAGILVREAKPFVRVDDGGECLTVIIKGATLQVFYRPVA